MRVTRLLLAPALGLGLALTGCGGSAPDTACGRAWQQAVDAGASAEQPEQLLPTYTECGSYEEWRLSAEDHEDVLGGTEPEVFARDACDFTEALATAPVCSTLPV